MHFRFDSDDNNKRKSKRHMSKGYTADSSYTMEERPTRKLKRKRRENLTTLSPRNTEERPSKRLKRQMSQSTCSQSNQGEL